MSIELDSNLILYDTLFTEQEKYKPIWQNAQRLYDSRFKDKDFKFLKKKKRSRIFIPVTRNTVNIMSAIFATAFFSRGFPIELVAVNENEKDLVVYRNKVAKYYYDKFKPTKELVKAFKSALLFGMGIVITYWGQSKRKVITTFIPITDIAFDHECTSIDDIEHVGYRFYESERVIKEKIKSGYYNQKKLLKKIFDQNENRTSKRREIKVIYIKTQKGYLEETFIDNILVRKKNFKKLPFQFGHAISKLPDVDVNKRKDEILCYGDTIPSYLEPLQNEINHKRNIKNDIQEKILNPDVYIGDQAKVDPADLNYGSGKRIRVNGKVDQIKERTIPSEYALNTDLAMLSGDIDSAVGTNKILGGETSASDRRSGNALATVNANSSMRLEEMIMLLNETLFEHWAKTWIELVMKNADDDVIHKITGRNDYPLGRKGKRDSIEYDLKINFGMTIDKQNKINSKMQTLQILSQNNKDGRHDEKVERILKDILMLIDGDDIDYADLEENLNQDKGETSEETNPVVDENIQKLVESRL